jgi:hypothetical protein
VDWGSYFKAMSGVTNLVYIEERVQLPAYRYGRFTLVLFWSQKRSHLISQSHLLFAVNDIIQFACSALIHASAA